MPQKIGLQEFEPISEALGPVLVLMRSMGLVRLDVKDGIDNLGGLKSDEVRTDVEHRDGSTHHFTLWRYHDAEG